MSQGQLSALMRLTQQPLVYIVQMLPTSFLPQTTICNHSASTICDSILITQPQICLSMCNIER